MRYRLLLSLGCVWIYVVLTAQAATPPSEPELELGEIGLSGFREHSFRAPTPPSSPYAWTVGSTEARELINSGQAIPIDVQASIFRPASAQLAADWLPNRQRQNIPGSFWLPNMGYPDIEPELDQYYQTQLTKISDHNYHRGLLLYCIADCWLAWNAVKRVAAYGYTRLYWYPQGVDGWHQQGWPLQNAQPEPFPVHPMRTTP